MLIRHEFISGLLCEILGVVFSLVDGLLVLDVEPIVPYGDHCKFVKYTDILVLLGIKLKRNFFPCYQFDTLMSWYSHHNAL